VKPGEELELLFGIADAGDGLLTSTVLLDSLEWSVNESQVVTGDVCKLGGTGSCGSCLNTQITKCCADPLLACQKDDGGSSNGCNGILSCLQICAGNAACQQGCYDTRPGGQAEYNAYRDCLYGPAADPTNLGACGAICK
jgi:hypothetical protein